MRIHADPQPWFELANLSTGKPPATNIQEMVTVVHFRILPRCHLISNYVRLRWRLSTGTWAAPAPAKSGSQK